MAVEKFFVKPQLKKPGGLDVLETIGGVWESRKLYLISEREVCSGTKASEAGLSGCQTGAGSVFGGRDEPGKTIVERTPGLSVCLDRRDLWRR